MILHDFNRRTIREEHFFFVFSSVRRVFNKSTPLIITIM